MTTPEPSLGVSLWNRFVETADERIGALSAGVSNWVDSDSTHARALAYHAFETGMSSLLVGADDFGRLALAVERVLDAVDKGSVSVESARTLLEAPCEMLSAAVFQLKNADRSGARIEGLNLTDLTTQLENAVSDGRGRVLPAAPTAAPKAKPSIPPPPPAARPVESPSPASGNAEVFQWTPTVDEDMVELFFDEASERIEGISGKLIILERTPGDMEVLRDLFRDLHTVKGSSAMVGLSPVNRLAHAAEDLVGQLRDGERAADANVTNVLLAALDALRSMLDQVRSQRRIQVDPAPILKALKDPSTPLSLEATPPAAIIPAPQTAAIPTHPTASAPTHPTTESAQTTAAARQTIRVDFDKLDRLLNLVGELVLGRDGLRNAVGALSSITEELSSDRSLAKRVNAKGRKHSSDTAERAALGLIRDELSRVERVLGSITADLDASTANLDSISGELRDQVMRLRMIPVGGVFRKHQRTVRDLGQSLGKRVHLELVGEDTELDKLLVEALDEPLLHLVRNAVDHGMELPDQRMQAGKPPEGNIVLSAAHRGNQVVIRIADDGRGMDPTRLKQKAIEKGILSQAEADGMDDRAATELIFRAGFSTAATISDVSGRGVGLDVVRQTIVTRLKGTIDIDSKAGRGTTFTLKLPLTLAIISVILARVCGETLAIPLDSVERTLVLSASDVHLIGDREMLLVGGKNVPLVRLSSVLELSSVEADDAVAVVLTEHGGEMYGLACDQVLGKREIVIKSLGELLKAVPCVAGATLLGDQCALILDIPAVVERALKRPTVERAQARARSIHTKGSILVVDDSDVVRETLKRLISDAGYEVTTADDGRAALSLCKTRVFDLVSTDVMMPHMDGYELTRALRAMPTYRDIPIVMVTTRGERIDRVRGFDAGVDDYITKPHDRKLLLQSIQKLLGHDGEES
ncbi:MAG: response regulator [Polyangiaceae bacterium]|nr:response regulator [Polyangiaceae bacterium]